jgi:hypothetical protein
MPEGWGLGRQYQRCPVCQKPVQLLEAGNHMTCPKPCKTDYCYICGLEVSEEELSSHWTAGSCPQYNHPDDDDAAFAPDGGDNDDRMEGNYVPTEEERLERLHAPFDGFHAGMVLDERTQRIMLSILTLDGNYRPTVQTDEDIDWVLAAMTEYRHSHGIDRAEWDRITGEYSRWLRKVITRPAEKYSTTLWFSRHHYPLPTTSGVTYVFPLATNRRRFSTRF